MKKRQDGIVESSNEAMAIYELTKLVKQLSKRVEQLEQEISHGNHKS